MKNKSPAHYQKTLLLMMVITAVAVDVSVPILPFITDYFQVSKNRAPLIISSFLAGYGFSMIPVGLLSDRYGRLPIMYIGLMIYVLSGFIISVTPNFETVLWGRFFQGVGGAVGPVNARAIARDMTSGKDLAKLMSSLAAALFFAPICAPIIGGQLYNSFNWQMALLVPPVLGILLLISVWLTAYETLPRTAGIQKSLWVQFSNSTKMYFSSRKSTWALLIILTSFPAYHIILANASILMTDIYNINENKVGIILGLTSILIVGATIFNKQKAQFISPEKLLSYGILLSMLATTGFIVCYLLAPLPFWIVWIFVALYFAATGIIFSNTSTIALAPLSKIAGFASSVFGAAMILGASFATTLAANFYDGTLISITAGIIICALLSAIIFFTGVYFQQQKSNS